MENNDKLPGIPRSQKQDTDQSMENPKNMNKTVKWLLPALLLLTLSGAAAAQLLPISTYKLDNGLTLVVSEDHSSPTFGLSIVYHVGFRLEPKGRTGFAHLFEHMMFEGTPNAPKGSFVKIIQGGGGSLNGSTRYDYTNYISKAPVSALEPILWLEADRMRHLDFSKENLDNQRDVVKEEIRVNVKNKPYGLFFWTDLAALAFDKWENAHDGYGSFVDLDNANIEDVKRFHATYYTPNNAVIAIAGDVDADQVYALVNQYFGDISSAKLPPRPDVSETLNTKERFKLEMDDHATAPALAIGWKMPGPESPDYYPLAVLGDLLLGGEASLLYQKMVKEKRSMLSISGGMAWPLGNVLTIAGPSLTVAFGIYKPGSSAKQNVDAIQAVIEEVARNGVTEERLQAVKTKMVADYYKELAHNLNRADYLAISQLIHGDANLVNRYPDLINGVTTGDIQRAAAKYLTIANRSWIDRQIAPQHQEKQ
ncbi:M16 family metallopeptidase [Thiolapillus sp.]